jgi:aldose sugar dehydrogenase
MMIEIRGQNSNSPNFHRLKNIMPPKFLACSVVLVILVALLALVSWHMDYYRNGGVIEVDYVAYAAPTLRDSGLIIQTVETGLASPTSMAFLDPYNILVLEKNKGTVQRIKNGNLLPQPLLDVNVASNSERGMLGIGVVKLATNTFHVFLYFTEAQSTDGGTAIANRLYRYTFIDDPNAGPAQGRMTSPKLILDLPVSPGPNHNGGKVLVGGAGNVNLITGDLNRQTKAQNFENGPSPDGTSGILKVSPDGLTVGGGILGSTHPLDKYYAYGIRNSFGFDFDPLTGKRWDTENGPGSNDEINFVGAGFNSGWRDLMGIAPAGFDFANLESFGGRGKYSDPEFVWTQVVAPTAIKFLNSKKLGTSYENDLFVGDYNKGRIYRFDLNSQRTALSLSGVLADKVANTDSETQSIIFGEGFGGITDLQIAPWNGYLYVLSITQGTLYRILPQSTVSTVSMESGDETIQLVDRTSEAYNLGFMAPSINK